MIKNFFGWLLDGIKKVITFGYRKLVEYLKQVDDMYHVVDHLKHNSYENSPTGPPRGRNMWSFMKVAFRVVKSKLIPAKRKDKCVPLEIDMPKFFMRGKKNTSFDRLGFD